MKKLFFYKFQNNRNVELTSTFLYFLTIILLLLAAYFFIAPDPKIVHAITLATTVQPETFTELYFADHLQLPQSIEPGNVYSFKFTIHNLENKDIRYPYEVYLDLGSEKITIDKNTVVIKNNASKTTQERFVIDTPLSHEGKIVVKLIDKNQQIDFWGNK